MENTGYNHVGMIPFSTLKLFGGEAERLLQQAVDHGHGEMNLADVLDYLSDLRMIAFGEIRNLTLQSIVVVQVARYPRLSALRIAYGSGRDVAHLLPALVEFCKEQNITRLETWCRESVARLYRKHGFDMGYCVPVMEI